MSADIGHAGEARVAGAVMRRRGGVAERGGSATSLAISPVGELCERSRASYAGLYTQRWGGR